MNQGRDACPSCGAEITFDLDSGQLAQHACEASGAFICELCAGTGCIDTPTSEDDPSCEECSGQGWAI